MPMAGCWHGHLISIFLVDLTQFDSLPFAPDLINKSA